MTYQLKLIIDIFFTKLLQFQSIDQVCLRKTQIHSGLHLDVVVLLSDLRKYI